MSAWEIAYLPSGIMSLLRHILCFDALLPLAVGGLSDLLTWKGL